MKPLVLALLAATLVAAPPAGACDRSHCLGSHGDFDVDDLDSPARWAPRHPADEARFLITTRDRKVELLLTDRVVAFQLASAKMDHIERELRHEQNDEEENAFATAVKTAVVAAVRVVLKHSAECPVSELSDVEYRDGALVFTTRSGDPVFGHMQVDGNELTASFSERDARAFVRE